MESKFDIWRTITEEVLDVRNQPYEATVPATVADLSLPLRDETLAEADDATMSAVRLDAHLATGFGTSTDHIAVLLARLEALASSAIERIHSSPLDLAAAVIRPRQADDRSRLVAANVNATQAALNLLGDEYASVTDEQLLRIHGTLLGESAPHLAGSWREGAVWIGGPFSTLRTATYVAPAAQRVPGLIDDLCAYANRRDVPVLAHAAITHAQYETIHPHGDGNGRTGRALVHGLLRRGGITQAAVIPFSTVLHARVHGYYDALKAYRTGNVDAVVEVFSDAIAVTLVETRALLDEIDGIVARWIDDVEARFDSVVWRHLPHLISQPVVGINDVARLHDVSYPAAQRAVEALVDAGVLTPLTEQRRNRLWFAPEVTSAMDGFGQRVRDRR